MSADQTIARASPAQSLRSFKQPLSVAPLQWGRKTQAIGAVRSKPPCCAVPMRRRSRRPEQSPRSDATKGSFVTRDQYIHKLKTDLARWNDQIDAWETRMGEFNEEWRAHLRTHLNAWREQRDVVLERLQETQAASEAAWRHTARGTDEAWLDLARAYSRAGREFDLHQARHGRH